MTALQLENKNKQLVHVWGGGSPCVPPPGIAHPCKPPARCLLQLRVIKQDEHLTI